MTVFRKYDPRKGTVRPPALAFDKAGFLFEKIRRKVLNTLEFVCIIKESRVIIQEVICKPFPCISLKIY